MKALSRGLLLSFLASGLCQSVNAGSKSALVWKDGKGIESLDNCHEVSSEQISLRIAGETELAKSRHDSVHLNDRSLVKALKSNPQLTTVQVVAVAQSASSVVSEGKSAQRLDEGLISTEKIQAIDDYVLEIQDRTAQQKLGGNFLQISMQDGHYTNLVCGTGRQAKKFAIYNVFNAKSEKPVARVGVEESETQLFKAVRVHTSEEADRLLNHLSQEIQAQDAQTDVQSGGSFLNSSTAAKKQKEATKADAKASAPQVHLTTTLPLNFKTGSGGGGKQGENLSDSTGDSKDADSAVQPMPADITLMTPMLVAVTGSAIDSVVCLADGTLPVRDEALQNVLFQANKLEVVKVVQGFSAPKDSKFVKVQFNGRPAGKNTGWVAKEYIQLKSQCSLTKPAIVAKAAVVAEQATASVGNGGELSNDCCSFPLNQRPTTSYKEGMRRFGWNRARGRIHAACDLYGGLSDTVVAVNDGVVVRDRYAFYGGVYALEVVHTGGFVVRYGEVTGKGVAGVSKGTKVGKGKPVGFVGQVGGHGKLSPMLHFELYTGSVAGPLSQTWRKGYQRRADLINPTDYLSHWEQAKFGESF